MNLSENLLFQEMKNPICILEKKRIQVVFIILVLDIMIQILVDGLKEILMVEKSRIP